MRLRRDDGAHSVSCLGRRPSDNVVESSPPLTRLLGFKKKSRRNFAVLSILETPVPTTNSSTCRTLRSGFGGFIKPFPSSPPLPFVFSLSSLRVVLERALLESLIVWEMGCNAKKEKSRDRGQIKALLFKPACHHFALWLVN